MSNSHSHPPLKSVTLTHEGPNRKSIGSFPDMDLFSPVFISVGGFVSHFNFRRGLQGMFFASGLSILQLINEIIKSSIQQTRPKTCVLLEMCDSHGWPSSHSQQMLFFAVYFTFLTYYKIGILARLQLWVVGILMWPSAILTMYSMVYLGNHTVARVFARAALGSVLGFRGLILCSSGTGASASVIAATFVCPLDVIKTMFQVLGRIPNANIKARVNELRFVDLLDGLCEKMQD